MTRGERNCAWIEARCRVPEGKLVGKPVKLAPFQREIICGIYDTPTRRAIISFGRKNAKTTLAAFLLLLHLCGPEAKPNSQLFSAAQSKEQAGVLFNLAAKVVRLSPDLLEFVAIRDTVKQLACLELGTLYRALSAEASTAYGLSTAFVVHDELGQVRGPRSELYEALESAAAAQEEPLSVIISTQAPTAADLMSVLLDDALTGADPMTKVWLYTAPLPEKDGDPEEDPFAVETIRKANPAFDYFMNQQEVLAQARDASRMPSREASYRNLILNQRVDVVSPFISRGVWLLNSFDVEDEAFSFGEVFGGLDLSGRTALTALVLIAWFEGRYHFKCVFWTPEMGLKDRSKADRVPYDLWVQQGYIRTVPGRTIDYEFLAKDIADIVEGMDLKAIAYDRWRIDLFRKELEEVGVELPLKEFGQGFKDMAPALDTLEDLLLSEKVAHGNNPVLTYCMQCARVEKDAAGNRKLNKTKSNGRIDGAVAAVMAAAMLPNLDETGESFWQTNAKAS